MNFSKAIEVGRFDNKTIIYSNFNNLNVSKNGQFDISKIHILYASWRHDNTKILALSEKDSDIFYAEDQPLSFTKKTSVVK